MAALDESDLRLKYAVGKGQKRMVVAEVATFGAVGVEVAQEVLAKAQGAILPLVSYFFTLRWLFIALALGRITVAVWARMDDWKKGLADVGQPRGRVSRPALDAAGSGSRPRRAHDHFVYSQSP